MEWPSKHDLFGVQVSATTYQEAEDLVIAAARNREPAVVTHLPVHGVVLGAEDAAYRRSINAFQIVAPDGQPVRWALNRFFGTNLRDRVYGPELMLRLCRRAAAEGIGIYLYGGASEEVLNQLKGQLVQQCPGLRIAGAESPPFRPLTEEEDEAAVRRINDSGAGLVFIGIGLPKQDFFAYAHREKIHGVQLCVGAAFDFHAGSKKMAPPWMQRHGLEWLFRLVSEPRRLWKRYFRNNTLFLWLVGRRMLRGR